jgi:hypothetical protein
MTEKRRKQIVYSIFVIAVTWAIFNFPHQKKKPIQSESPQISEGAPVVAAAVAELPTRPELAVPDQWGRDPFARSGGRVTSEPSEVNPSFRVAAISMGGGKAMAVINGKMIGQGETIQGWRVKAISNAGVVLESNGRKITLTIGGE